MKKFTLIIDAFGQSPQFLIKRKNYNHSVFGGIITIILYGISIISLIFFSQELFLKRAPSVNLSTESDEHPEKIQYYGNYEFLIGIQSSSMIVHRDETIYKAKGFIFQTLNTNNELNNVVTEIDLESCDIALADSNVYEFVKDINLEDYYCFARSQSKVSNNDLFINDFWNNDGFQMIQVKFMECQNTTEDQSCKSQEEINQYLKLQEISLYYIDNFVETTSYEEPFKKGIREVFYYISNDYTFYLTNYIQHLQIVSDDGLLFTTKKVKDTFIVDNMRDLTNYQKTQYFASYTIQFNNIKQLYYRKYYKLQDLAAQVGGVFKTLMIIGIVVTKLFEEHEYYQHLINNFFDIRTDDEENNNAIIQLSKKIEKSISTSTKPVESINTDLDFRKNGDCLKGKHLKKKKLELHFIDKAFLLSFFPKYSKANKENTLKVYMTSRDQIASYLEIDKTIRNIYNQEALWNLIFSEEQEKLFNYVFSPILTNKYIGTRYSGDKIPRKIKKVLRKGNPIFTDKVFDKVKEVKNQQIKSTGFVGEEILDKQKKRNLTEFYEYPYDSQTNRTQTNRSQTNEGQSLNDDSIKKH